MRQVLQVSSPAGRSSDPSHERGSAAVRVVRHPALCHFPGGIGGYPSSPWRRTKDPRPAISSRIASRTRSASAGGSPDGCSSLRGLHVGHVLPTSGRSSVPSHRYTSTARATNGQPASCHGPGPASTPPRNVSLRRTKAPRLARWARFSACSSNRRSINSGSSTRVRSQSAVSSSPSERAMSRASSRASRLMWSSTRRTTARTTSAQPLICRSNSTRNRPARTSTVSSSSCHGSVWKNLLVMGTSHIVPQVPSGWRMTWDAPRDRRGSRRADHVAAYRPLQTTSVRGERTAPSCARRRPGADRSRVTGAGVGRDICAGAPVPLRTCLSPG